MAESDKSKSEKRGEELHSDFREGKVVRLAGNLKSLEAFYDERHLLKRESLRKRAPSQGLFILSRMFLFVVSLI